MFVLSVVRPPEGGAKYGKATVYEGLRSRLWAANKGADLLIEAGVPEQEARNFGAYDLWYPVTVGTFVDHEGTGLTFRVDRAGEAPTVCSCCGGLVLNGRARCHGCSPWDSNTPACLPENSAHAEKG
jgi:hypothetical protein